MNKFLATLAYAAFLGYLGFQSTANAQTNEALQIERAKLDVMNKQLEIQKTQSAYAMCNVRKMFTVFLGLEMCLSEYGVALPEVKPLEATKETNCPRGENFNGGCRMR